MLRRICNGYSIIVVSSVVLLSSAYPSLASWIPSSSSTTTATSKKYHTCQEIVADYVASDDFQMQSPLQRTVFFVPPNCCSRNVLYKQVATQTTYQGWNHLRLATEQWWWDMDQESNNNNIEQEKEEWQLDSKLVQITSLSPTSVQVSWNVTWVPPTVLLWQRLGSILPGLHLVYTTYNHRSSFVSTFSWNAVAQVLLDAVRTGQWQVPLACIQGTSRLEFIQHQQQQEEGDDEKNEEEEEERQDDTKDAESTAGNCYHYNGWRLRSITEDLVYAQDLQQGRLLHRKCAADLRLFLEIGRRRLPLREEMYNEQQDYEAVVATCLPWSNVPGSGPLDIEPMLEEESGQGAAVIFLAACAMVMVGFAAVVAPELLR